MIEEIMLNIAVVLLWVAVGALAIVFFLKLIIIPLIIWFKLKEVQNNEK